MASPSLPCFNFPCTNSTYYRNCAPLLSNIIPCYLIIPPLLSTPPPPLVSVRSCEVPQRHLRRQEPPTPPHSQTNVGDPCHPRSARQSFHPRPPLLHPWILCYLSRERTYLQSQTPATGLFGVAVPLLGVCVSMGHGIILRPRPTHHHDAVLLRYVI